MLRYQQPILSFNLINIFISIVIISIKKLTVTII